MGEIAEIEVEEWKRERMAAENVAKGSRSYMTAAERQKHGAAFRWEYEVMTGKWTPPPLVQRFLDEQCLDPAPSLTLKRWAEENGVAERTARRWKTDPRVVALWKQHVDTTYMHPEFITPVIDNVHRTAISSGPQAMKAAELLLKMLDKIAPPTTKVVISLDEEIRSMSTADLIEISRTGSLPSVDAEVADGFE